MLLRHLAAVVTALALASGVGLLAGSFGDDQFWLRAGVFAACSVPPAYGIGWLLFVAPAIPEGPVTHVEETVEHQWWQESATGAFLDIIAVAGIASFALAVTDLRIEAQNPLAALILLGFADVAVRFTVLRRRNA
ncbi:hypothetical protein [Blastococcus tunisiensis]|uniref:Uncharacterized protein n=1 Tax=Blastococcus tunisiensis TaxID=1798228 RepID=A0A1I2H148_9ACTN|nr:hypothetical protein [Blastococcus sp. DSM 46838]SFF23103.1 hypothetical protein SAMN05216574_11073 [Blastococcus sp. DSM 46838]